MAKENKPAGAAKPIVDVAHPGKTAPSPTSKPVIVTNRPILKDPMVVDKTESNEPAAPTAAELIASAPSKAATKIEPLETTDAKTEKTVLTAPIPENIVADEKPEVEAVPTEDKIPDTPVPEIKKAEEPPITDPSSEDETSKIADETSEASPAAIEAAEAEQQVKHDAEITKLVDSKEYNLPINTIENRRTKRAIILGIVLSIVLVIAWVDIALDAGLIKIDNVKPVTHFFSS